MNAASRGALAVPRANALRAAIDRQFDDDAEKWVAAGRVALAAVIERIEAVTEFRAGIAALVVCQEQGAPQDIYDAVAARYQTAAYRLRAAFERIGGAA